MIGLVINEKAILSFQNRLFCLNGFWIPDT